MATKRHDWKETSRLDWGTILEEGKTLPTESIVAGCMMRIATATEAMANNYTQLIQERDQYKRWNEDKKRQIENLENRLRTQKGLTTRYRNQLAVLKGQNK